MIEALIPYIPLVLMLGVTGLLVVDRWLQRPGFSVEMLTVSSICMLAIFGLVGIVTGNPITQENVELNTPMVLVAQAGQAMLYGGLLFGCVRQAGEGPGRLMWLGVTSFALFAGFAELVNPGPVNEVFIFLILTSYLLWRSPGADLDRIVRITKLGLWFITILGLIFIPTSLGWVETGGSLIGLPRRFVGVTSHPNAMGPWMVYLLLLNLIKPPVRRWAIPAWGIPIMVLILTQSKTAWAGAIVGAAVVWWFRVGVGLLDRFRWLPGAMVMLFALSAVLLFSAVPAQEFLSADEAEELTTLTGRTRIWGAGIEAFLENPVFGAGKDVYTQYAEDTGQEWAGQAHNEFVQTLAADGLVGMAGLMIYLFVLLFLGLRLAPVSAGASMALVVTFVLRWLTETPVRSVGFEQVLVLGLLIAWSRKDPIRSQLQNVRFRDLLVPPADNGQPGDRDAVTPVSDSATLLDATVAVERAR